MGGGGHRHCWKAVIKIQSGGKREQRKEKKDIGKGRERSKKQQSSEKLLKSVQNITQYVLKVGKAKK